LNAEEMGLGEISRFGKDTDIQRKNGNWEKGPYYKAERTRVRKFRRLRKELKKKEGPFQSRRWSW